MIKLQHSSINGGNDVRVPSGVVTIQGNNTVSAEPNRNSNPPVEAIKTGKGNLTFQINNVQLIDKPNTITWLDILSLRQLDVNDSDPVILKIFRNDNEKLAGDSGQNIPVTLKNFSAVINSNKRLAKYNISQLVITMNFVETRVGL